MAAATPRGQRWYVRHLCDDGMWRTVEMPTRNDRIGRETAMEAMADYATYQRALAAEYD